MSCWLTGDIAGAMELARSVPDGDPDHAAARALLAGVAFDHAECTLDEARLAHDAALQTPPADPDLHVSLLRNQAFFLIGVNRLTDARRLLRELEDLLPTTHPRLRLAGQLVRWWLASSQDDYAEQLAAIEHGFRLVDEQSVIPAERVGLARLMLHEQRFEAAMSNHDLPLAAQALEAIAANQSHALFPGWVSLEVLGANLLELQGRFAEGLELLRQIEPETHRSNAKAADLAEATLLIRSGRSGEASPIVERLRLSMASRPGASAGRSEVSPAEVASLEALAAMSAGDLARVWDAAEAVEAASKSDRPTWSSRATELLIGAALTTQRQKLARRLLEREDPEQSKRRHRVHWTRLLWLEGRRAEAVACFSDLLADLSPDCLGYAAQQLQFALELTPYDVASLWADATPRPAATPMSHAALDSGTIGRRRRLMRLFDEHGRLTRAQAAALLGCAPTTATRDLAALVAERRIERVETSSHLRTGYFRKRENA